jgi:uncharacterized membrane protein YedE/YeeE
MENFTPISALIGGAMIGFASVLLMLFNGRIAGISGIVAGSLFGDSKESRWRWWFLGGLVAGPLTVWLVSGDKPAFVMEAGWPTIAVAGLLVGFGTRLGSGCTSGHGVCGLARLSGRSLVAVLLFMGVGMLTVAGVRWFGGLI